MDEIVLFEAIDKKLIFTINDKVNYEIALDTLRSKLEGLYLKEKLKDKTLEIDVLERELNNKEVLMLFDVFSGYEDIVIQCIKSVKKAKKELMLHEGSIRAGEVKFFKTNTLLVGNINKGAKVIVNGNIYIIGKVQGEIEVRYSHNKIIAARTDNSYVKIANFEKQIEETGENREMFLDEREIRVSSSIKGRRIHLGKNNSSYLW